MEHRALFALITAFVVLPQAVAAPVTIVDDARVVATIVLPDDPTFFEKVAAEDLQLHLREMSSGKLPIVAEKDRPGGLCIDIASSCRGIPHRERLEKRQDLNPEALVIKVEPGGVVLVGRTDSATKHAIYILLEQLGIHWVLPSNLGTHLPRRRTVALSEQTLVDQPAFVFRSGLPASTEYDPRGSRLEDLHARFNHDLYTWCNRNRLGGSLKRELPGHTYNFLVPRDNFPKHPEYFALNKYGQREITQLCTSNPDVIRLAIQTARAWAKVFPDMVLSFGPNDGHGFCLCENCEKVKGDGGNVNDLIVTFANHAARALRDDYPNVRLAFYADYHHFGLPARVKPEPELVFTLVRWSVDRAHGIGHPNLRRWKRSLENWTGLGNPVILYTYYGHYQVFAYWPIVHVMKKEFPLYHKYGVIGLHSETHGHWGTQGLNFYVFSKLMWNPLADVDQLVDEYCRAFGPAAGTMRRYYELQHQTMAAASSHHGRQGDQTRVFRPDVVAKLQALMDEAVDEVTTHAAQHPDPGLAWRMAFVARGQRIARLDLDAHHAMQRFESTRDRSLLDTARRNWTEVVRLIEDPAMPSVVERSFADQVRNSNLAPLEESVVYGPGRFQYHDNLEWGGKTSLHALYRNGYTGGMWGLNLAPRTSGEVAWRFQSEPGHVFDNVKLVVYFSYREMDLQKLQPDDEQRFRGNSNKIEVRSPATGGKWITVVQNRDLSDEQFDLIGQARGATWFEMRFSGHNASDQTICAVDLFTVKGTVIEAKKAMPRDEPKRSP